MKCILNVTDHEYDKILQLTHDAVEWANRDCLVIDGIQTLLGSEVTAEMKGYDECRMEKHDDVSGLRRVTPAPELATSASATRMT